MVIFSIVFTDEEGEKIVKIATELNKSIEDYCRQSILDNIRRKEKHKQANQKYWKAYYDKNREEYLKKRREKYAKNREALLKKQRKNWL